VAKPQEIHHKGCLRKHTVAKDVQHQFSLLSGKGNKENKVGQRTQKQDGAQHVFCGVGSGALHGMDVRSLLTHRVH
jgi:hypothetical protein